MSTGILAPELMGIVNVTPDSFSDGGRYLDVASALAHAEQLYKQGATILDIGGESTRPGMTPVSFAQEQQRVMPVLQALHQVPWRQQVRISIDTTKSLLADEALLAGADMINDVWGLQGDAKMASIIARHKATIVIMHNREVVDEALDIIIDIQNFWQHSLQIAEQAGIARNKIILDPGIGFGKTAAQNIIILQNLQSLIRGQAYPVLIGVSRKSVIGFATGEADSAKRLPGSLVANLQAASAGAHILRIHDVAAHRQALLMQQALTAMSH